MSLGDTVAGQQLLQCEEHGEQRPVSVCRHLLNNGKRHALGLFEADYDPDTNKPTEYRMAWCKACDDTLKVEREWTPQATAFADPGYVCGSCFEQILRTQLQLNPLEVVLSDNDI